MSGRPGRARRWVGAVLVGAALAGCATPGLAPTRAAEEVRPEALPEYDFLVAREHELEGDLPAALAAYRRALAKDPDSPLLLRKVAELLARQGQLNEAVPFATRALELEPEDEETRLFLGTLHRLRRDTAAAEQVLLDEQGEPRSVDAALLLYGVYIDADRPERALEVARWLRAREPTNLRAFFAEAGALQRLGRHEEAEAVLREALREHPGSLAVYGALARARRERGDREGEVEIYRELLRHHPDHHGTLVALAQALIDLERFDEAREVLDRIAALHPEDLRSLIRLAFLELEAGLYEPAAAHFERALQASPQQHELAYFLGVARRQMGDLDGAIAALEQVPPDHERYADARAQLAAIFERRGDLARAIEEAERALRASPSRPLELYVASLRARAGDVEGAIAYLEQLAAEAPDDPEVLYNLAVVMGEAGRVEDALRLMQRVLELDPNHAGALNFIGYTWAEQGRNLDEAERLITRALELRPEDGYITDSLGWLYYMRARPLLEAGRIEEGRALLERAIRELERAEKLTGGDPVIAEHLGDAYLLLDQRRRALELYEKALELGPRESEQPELREKAERLRRELGAR